MFLHRSIIFTISSKEALSVIEYSIITACALAMWIGMSDWYCKSAQNIWILSLLFGMHGDGSSLCEPLLDPIVVINPKWNLYSNRIYSI